jgi:hypothetical protein
MNTDDDRLEVVHSQYCPPPPMILVAVFGSLVIVLDEDGLHVAIRAPTG